MMHRISMDRMSAEMTPSDNQKDWKHRVSDGVVAWLQRSDLHKGMSSPHLWAIVFLLALLTFIYYVDTTLLASISPFNSVFFSGVHDIHRTLFLIPILYAAVKFRIMGSLISLAVFMCVVIPRAVLISPYPDPLARPMLFVAVAFLMSLFTAMQLNRMEVEHQARAELAEAYQQLKEAQRQLIHAEKLTAMGQLSASIAHEVNNPISGILIYTQLLAKKLAADKLEKEKALEYLSLMESELSRTGGIIRNLLDFARQTEPTSTLVKINDIVDRTLKLVKHAAEMQRVVVVKELRDGLPLVMADHNQIQQVLTNLMLNAIQSMQGGGTLTLRTLEDNAGFIKVEINDTGIGISEENMQKLFTPFFSTKKEVKGVGLGLAMSYGIIQRHQGKMEVQSELGKGSTFTVYLKTHNDGET